MNEFERAVLTVLMRAGEPLGWYRIERSLSGVALSERPNLLDVLADLRRRGFVDQVTPATEPKARYTVTSKGKAAIEVVS